VGLRAGLDMCEKSHPTGIRSSDRPARRQSLYRLSYRAHGEDIVRFIKAQRIQWLDHVERMDETAMPKRVLKGKLYATKIGRLRNRWLEDVIADLRRMEIGGWMEKASNRDQWGRIVEGAKVHPGLQR